MLPGKKYTPEDFAAIAWRRRWLIVLPLVIVTAATVTFAKMLPNTYRSETLVLVVPQRIPEEYVRSTVTARIEDRVRSIREQILSRSRLERIVDELNLYTVERQRIPMEEIIDGMRENVFTRVVREDAFSVSFVASSPVVAQKVTERLASMFSEENMRDREVLAESTNQFLQTQLDEARQRLTQHEQRVEAFRRKYAGELPEQVISNMQTIQNTEVQIQTLVQSLNSDRERKILLERQIAELASSDVPLPPDPGQPGRQLVLTSAQQVEAAEAAVRSLEARVTAEHPDLVRARLAVKRLRQEVAAERPSTEPESGARLTAAEVAHRNRLAALRGQLDGADRQIADKLQEEKRLRQVVTGYRTKVEAAPGRETELVSLNRDYETLQRQYRSLLEKYEESKVAANLERRQIGEQFRILDPARVPERPFTPNRPFISLAGAGFGLLLGLALAGALEFKDASVRSVADVTLCFALPVLAALPSLPTGAERAHAHRRRALLWTVGTTLGLALLTAVAVWRVGG